MSTNNPPIDTRGHAVMTLKRATGEIEIRTSTPEGLWNAQMAHPDHRFGDHEQLGPLLWAVKGMQHGRL